MSAAYVPGVCNIGPAEIARRRDIGVAGTAVAVAVVAASIGLRLPRGVRLLAVGPAVAGAGGFLQARARFCGGFGFRGLRNLGAVGGAEDVEAEQDRRADRAKAVRIGVASALIGTAAATASLLLP